MATIRAYTTIEQSRKLAEILPHESADMQYISFRHKDDTIEWIPRLGIPSKYDIPCWSLAALLDVLPTLDGRNAVLCKDTKYDEWHICYHSTATLSVIDTERYDNPIDACYEMILKLHDLKML